MAFKTITEYNEDRYSNMFMLKNDGDSADVIFLYRNIDDVLVAEAHYIKSDSYSGYVQCLGHGCPACERGIRVQNKLFIPMYVLSENKILFWDRSIRFQQQMENDVFSKFACPYDYVFRITRNGGAGDINTRYSIQAVAKNSNLSYDELLKSCNVTMPEYYNTICKDWDIKDFKMHLSSASQISDVESMPEYKITPRVVKADTELPDMDDLNDSDDLPDSDEAVDF